MKITIDNYTIYEKSDEVIMEIAAPQVEGFPFIQSDAYISNKFIEKGAFFISTKDKKNMITFKNMPKEDLIKLKSQKLLYIGLRDGEDSYKKIYEFDLKKIN